MSKVLFFTTQTIIPADGVSKKVFGQVYAMRNLGHEVHFMYPMHGRETIDLYLNDEVFISDMFHNSCYKYIIEYIRNNEIKALFIRYVVMASPRFLSFLRKASKYVEKIVIEIPTYPYDGEMKISSMGTFILKYKEKFCRQFLCNWVDYIMTYATDVKIFNIPCIHISNAPACRLPVKKESVFTLPIKMIAVANIAEWHGYDRLIEGMVEYNKRNDRKEIEVLIVGGGDALTIESLKSSVVENKLQKQIQFMGSKDGKELDELFDEADLAIGSLGRHRNGIKQLKTLKNVEYAMRGIPFVYSEDNEDFDGKPYVFKVPADETSIKIDELVKFIDNFKMNPSEISSSVSDMTWENQFKKVFKTIGL